MTTYEGIWKKWILIPLWIGQFIFHGSWLVISGIAIAFTVALLNERENNPGGLSYSDIQTFKDNQTAIFIVLGVMLAVALVEIIFNIVEIVQFSRRRLSPVLLIVLTALSLAFWVALLILNVVGAAHGQGGSVVWPILLIASYTAELIYAIIVLRRVRKGGLGARGTYAAAHVEAGYEPYTTYERQSASAANPFKDPSREPSPVPPTHRMYNPPVDRPQGAAQEYYAPEQIGQQSFEMHQTRPQ